MRGVARSRGGGRGWTGVRPWSWPRFAEQGLELDEELLDRVQIGTVGRQVEDGCAGRGERLADAVDPVRRQVVEHHDGARCEQWRQEAAPHRRVMPGWSSAIQHRRGHDAGLPQPGDEGRGAPMAVRPGCTRRRAARLRPSAAPCWWRCRSRRGRRTVPGPWSAARHASAGARLGPVLLGRSQRLFLCLRPIRRRA